MGSNALSSQNSKLFYQQFYNEKTKQDEELISNYQQQLNQDKNRQIKVYDYLGLIETRLQQHNPKEAYLLLKKMPKNLRYFTKDQKIIADIIAARVFYEKNDYARTVLLLNDYANQNNQIYFEKFAMIYLKSLMELNLNFQAYDYFNKNQSYFESKLNWEKLNQVLVQLAEFLDKIGEKQKALDLLTKPLLFFPLYDFGHKAMALLTQMECSEPYQGEKFHTPQNSSLLNGQIFHRIGKNPYARSYVYALANIDEKKIVPSTSVRKLNLDELKKLFEQLKVLVSGRDYDVAKSLVDYLYDSKIYGDQFTRDELLYLRGRIYNSLNQPQVASESYYELFQKNSSSKYAKISKLKYGLSLKFNQKYDDLIKFLKKNNLFDKKNDDLFFQFWVYYLNGNKDLALKALTDLLPQINSIDPTYSKVLYWKDQLLAANANQELENQFVGYPYPIFSRKNKENIIIAKQSSPEKAVNPSASLEKVVLKSTAKKEKAANKKENKQKFQKTKNVKDGKIKKEEQPLKILSDKKNKFFFVSELIHAHLNTFAKDNLLKILPELKKQEEIITYIQYTIRSEDFTGAAKQASILLNFTSGNRNLNNMTPEKRQLVEYYYPLAYWKDIEKSCRLLDLNPYWLLSVMRAESFYNPKAESSVGAVGLMQLMPYTGRKIVEHFSKNLKEPLSFEVSDLRIPHISITFGAWYLKQLLNNYNGNLVLATAAYNAGPTTINRWIRQHPEFNTAEFYENIPYNETKNYISSIFDSMDVYSKLYRNTPFVLDFDVTTSLKNIKPHELF